MSERSTRLQEAIEGMHKCKASLFDHVPIVEFFGEKVIWDGVVSTFDIDGHPKAKRCYAWDYQENGETKLVTVLGLPPVFTARDAVRASIIADIKSGKSGAPPS